MVNAFSHRERFNAVLKGEILDRPPITAYRHFPGLEAEPKSLADSLLSFQSEFDFDLLKVHPSAVYLQEIWGEVYDYSDYVSDVFPRRLFRQIDQLEKFHLFNHKDGNSAAMSKVLHAIHNVKKGLKEDTPVVHTLFTPIDILTLALDIVPIARRVEANRDDNRLIEYMSTHKDLLHEALEAISSTFLDYIYHAMDAGIDALFYSGMGYSRENYYRFAEWEEFIKKYDLKILQPLHDAGLPIIFHACGMHSNPQRFVDYPINVLHWDQKEGLNPPLVGAEKWLGKIIPMGGIDEELFAKGDSKKIEEAALRTLQANKNKPYIFSPGCSVSIHTKSKYLEVFRRSVDNRSFL